jgi:hypothetical protein
MDALFMENQTYSVYHTNLVREAAEQCGAKLVFIPPGCTDRSQPLDLRVLGVLKSYARQLWRTQYHRSHGAKTSRAQMAKNHIDAWDRISPDVIESAWAIYRRDWALYDSEDAEAELVDGEYQPDVRREDLEDLISKAFATSSKSIGSPDNVEILCSSNSQYIFVSFSFSYISVQSKSKYIFVFIVIGIHVQSNQIQNAVSSFLPSSIGIAGIATWTIEITGNETFTNMLPKPCHISSHKMKARNAHAAN